MRAIALAFWLVFLTGAACGFFFDRWLHRPLDIGQLIGHIGHIGQVDSRAGGQAHTPCYSDKSENCPSDPGPLNESPRGANPTREDRPAKRPIRPASGPCFFTTSREACQKAT